VAERVGFDDKAIKDHLVRKGYMKPGQGLKDFNYN